MEGKSLTDRIPMARNVEASGGTNVKGMEDLGNLPINFRGNLVSATTDEELSDLLSQAKSSKRPVVVNYGATWCHACRQMLPTFCNASNENPKTLFIYADIDKCEQETQDVRYTPTFRFYRDGDKNCPVPEMRSILGEHKGVRVLAISYDLHGHITPILGFTTELARKGITISFVYFEDAVPGPTSDKMSELRGLIFGFVTVPYPKFPDHTGLSNLPRNEREKAFKEALEPVMEKFIHDKSADLASPTCNISDKFL